YEDVDAQWIDVNNDGFRDLVIASGGNEFYGNDAHNLPRLYLNDGKMHLEKSQGAFPPIYTTASCIVAQDINSDGFTDLFIGSRTTPFEYGQIPSSWLLLNDGKGKFTDVTDRYAPDLKKAGMVTSAVWCDINKDGVNDLLLSTEWGGITAYVREKEKYLPRLLTDKKGWWNFVQPFDLDNDGDLDLVAGNLGLNSRLTATPDRPVRMYYDDFDQNGRKEQIITYYIGDRELPFANKAELEKQLPGIKKKFLYAEDFAKASLKELIGADQLKAATLFEADYFANTIFINDGKGNFTSSPMPAAAQFSPYRDAAMVQANDDNLPDILLVGNYYGSNIQMGRYDADGGTILINKGQGKFEAHQLNGLDVDGEVRHIRKVQTAKRTVWLLVRNDGPAMMIGFKQQ
ncbi:MAG: VCBS repeat-containing protein, partial [Chitinophagaceae bacterium]